MVSTVIFNSLNLQCEFYVLSIDWLWSDFEGLSDNTLIVTVSNSVSIECEGVSVNVNHFSYVVTVTVYLSNFEVSLSKDRRITVSECEFWHQVLTCELSCLSIESEHIVSKILLSDSYVDRSRSTVVVVDVTLNYVPYSICVSILTCRNVLRPISDLINRSRYNRSSVTYIVQHLTTVQWSVVNVKQSLVSTVVLKSSSSYVSRSCIDLIDSQCSVWNEIYDFVVTFD